MALNKFKPHVYILPEDDANRQLANGFLLHHQLATRSVQVRSPAGGWRKALFEVFPDEYLPLLKQSKDCHVVILIDFDEDKDRLSTFFDSLPQSV